MPKPLTPEQEQAKRERMQAKVGLASNALGLTAGTAGLAAAAKNPALRQKFKTTGEEHINPPMKPDKPGGMVTGRLAHKLKNPSTRGKLIAAGAAGAAGLQALNIGGDVVANRVMSRAAGEPETTKKSWEGGISKGWDGGDRVPGVGENLISKKAYRTRMEREQDRQKRAKTESDVLRYGAIPTAATGGALTGAGIWNYARAKPKPTKLARMPVKRLGGGAALLGGAALMPVASRRLKESSETEWT